MTAQSQALNLAAIKNRQQKTWTSGNYTRIGNTLVIMGELLCEAVNVHAGDKVLDVATGSGNTAISAARRFCDVTAIDYVPELIEDARRRAQVEGMEITFDVGDAEDLPYSDASFDVVLSTLGVMFAPDQEKAAEELLRICRPGGKIGLTNWTPEGFIGKMLRTLGKHVPPPPGIKSPPLWGTEQRLRELLGDGVTSLEVKQRSYVWRYPSAGHFVEYFRSYYGPTLKAFESLDVGGQEALEEDLEDLLESSNISSDATLIVPSDYLEVVAVRCR